MSKPWTPNKQTVELAPSRIRRAPVREKTIVARRTEEEEMWFGVAGVVVIAALLVILIVGIGVVTLFRATTAPDRSYSQCYSAGGQDCVLDGDTLMVAREAVEIAGIAAPRIQGAACEAERGRGITASVGLSNLLRSGDVTIGAPFPNPYGREVRTVQVDGRDVAARMIAAGYARADEGQVQDWCG